ALAAAAAQLTKPSAAADTAASRAKEAAAMSPQELGMLVPRGFTTWDAWDARHEPMPCGGSHSSPEDLADCQRAAFKQGLLVKPSRAQRRELERSAPAPGATEHPPHQAPAGYATYVPLTGSVEKDMELMDRDPDQFTRKKSAQNYLLNRLAHATSDAEAARARYLLQ